jgi:hypothetical protein
MGDTGSRNREFEDRQPSVSPGRPVASSPDVPVVSSPAATSLSGEPVTADHLGLALRAMAAGSLAGLAAVAAVLWLVRTLQVTGVAPIAPGPRDLVANLVLLAWLGGAGLGATIAWSLMAPIASTYRRGGLAMVAGFGTLLVAFVTAPVDSMLGRAGLLGLAVLATALFVSVLRTTLRHRSPPIAP